MWYFVYIYILYHIIGKKSRCFKKHYRIFLPIAASNFAESLFFAYCVLIFDLANKKATAAMTIAFLAI